MKKATLLCALSCLFIAPTLVNAQSLHHRIRRPVLQGQSMTWVDVAVGYVVGRVAYDLLMYVVDRFFTEKV